MPKSITDIMQTCHIPTPNKIAQLNDRFRQSGITDHWHFTPLTADCWFDLWLKIRAYDDFTPDNDPYGEHDLGKIEHQGRSYFWKIDYYDQNLEYLSPDPANPELTRRIITIMHTSEY